MEFSKREKFDLLMSTTIISFLSILYLILSGRGWIGQFIISFVAVGLSILARVAVQKRIGKKYDINVEYKIDHNLIFIAVLIGLLTNGAITFSAIGYTILSTLFSERIGHKYKNISYEESGKIALSGIITHLILALSSLVLYPINRPFFNEILKANTFMAIFNLIPIPPIDGHKIFWWSRLVWVTIFIISLFMMFFGFSIIFSIIGIITIVIITFIVWQKIF